MFSARVDLRSVDCIEHSRQKIKSYRGRVEYLELEQAKKRVEELRAVIEKNNRQRAAERKTIRMRRSWKILNTMP